MTIPIKGIFCVQSTRLRKSLLVCFSATSAGKKNICDTFSLFFHQEFKVFLLCFAVFVAATSAASVCKCEDKEVHKSDCLLKLCNALSLIVEVMQSLRSAYKIKRLVSKRERISVQPTSCSELPRNVMWEIKGEVNQWAIKLCCMQ